MVHIVPLVIKVIQLSKTAETIYENITLDRKQTPTDSLITAFPYFIFHCLKNNQSCLLSRYCIGLLLFIIQNTRFRRARLGVKQRTFVCSIPS